MYNLKKRESEIYSFLIGDVFLNFDTFDSSIIITPKTTLVEIGLRYDIIDIIILLEKEYKIDFKFLEYIDLKSMDEIIKLTVKKIKGKIYERRIRKLTKAAFHIL
mgnify:CR=1 FL=1